MSEIMILRGRMCQFALNFVKRGLSKNIIHYECVEPKTFCLYERFHSRASMCFTVQGFRFCSTFTTQYRDECKVKLLSDNSATKNKVNFRQYSSGNDNEVEVYYGALTPQIRTVKLFSLSTSCLGFIAQPFLLQQSSDLGGLPLMIVAGGIVCFFTYVTPFLLHFLTKKYVITLHYNPKTEEYKATVLTFFMRKRQVTFTPSDVVVPDVPGLFTSFLAKGVPLFVDPRFFENPFHYAKIMGYDKPIDLKLGRAHPGITTKETKVVDGKKSQ